MSRAFRLPPRVERFGSEADRWWAARSVRERLLLAMLGAVAVLAVLLTLVVRPLQSARADALAELRAYDAIEVHARAAGANPTSGTPRSGETASIALASASGYGVAVQIVGTVGTKVRLRVASAPYDAVVRWLADLGRTSRVRVERLTLQPASAPGAIAADLELSQ